MRIRKITSKEAWRLMGFSDEEYQRAGASGSPRHPQKVWRGRERRVQAIERREREYRRRLREEADRRPRSPGDRATEKRNEAQCRLLQQRLQ